MKTFPLSLFCLTVICVSSFADCPSSLRKIVQIGQPAHAAITEDLFRGRFTGGGPANINDNKHALWKVSLYNDQTGRSREAFFKPRQYGDEDGWGRIPMEYVAYFINRKLGMDYFPPTAYRKWININGQEFGEGAVIYAVPDTRVLYDTPEHEWQASKLAVQSDHRVLSVLLQNPDGHHKNLLLGKHWVDGTHRPIFIDFGASLRPGTNVSMTHYPAFRNSDSVDRTRLTTLENLRKLHWNHLQELREFISEDETRGILARRDGIVQYFEKLIRERGEKNVVLWE